MTLKWTNEGYGPTDFFWYLVADAPFVSWWTGLTDDNSGHIGGTFVSNSSASGSFTRTEPGGNAAVVATVTATSFIGDGSGLTGISPTLPQGLATTDSPSFNGLHIPAPSDAGISFGVNGCQIWNAPGDTLWIMDAVGVGVGMGGSDIYLGSGGTTYAAFSPGFTAFNGNISVSGNSTFGSGCTIDESGNISAPNIVASKVYPLGSQKMHPQQMLSDSQQGFVTIASSVYTTFNAWYIFDGYYQVSFTNVGWLAQLPLPAYVGLHFPVACVVTGVNIGGWQDGTYPGRCPKNFTIQGSNNGTTWVTLLTKTNITAWPGSSPYQLWYTFTNTTAYLYYRINITANNGDGSYTGLRQLEFY
jgi:hypothetical protein